MFASGETAGTVRTAARKEVAAASRSYGECWKGAGGDRTRLAYDYLSRHRTPTSP